MKKTNFYFKSGVLIAALLGAGNALAADIRTTNEPMYNFLPSDTVEQNVKNSLQSHGIDTSALQVNSDAKGVVQLSGLVGSKQDAEVATQVAKEADGVYAVLGAWRYELAAVPADSPAAMENAAPASGSAESQQ